MSLRVRRHLISRRGCALRVPITVHETAEFDVQGGAVMVAFPSFGLVGTLAANFLIEHLKLQEVGALDGESFPTLAVVEDGEPLSPIRLYFGHLDAASAGRTPLVLVLSEFQPDPPMVHELAASLLRWSHDKGAALMVSPEGLLVEEDPSGPDMEVFAAASLPELRERLRGLGTPLFRNGLVTGVTGTLLAMGKRQGMPIVGVLAEAVPDQPDARSAAQVVTLLGRLFAVDLDTSVLLAEAERFEARVAEAMRVQLTRDGERGHTQSVMYG